MIGKMRTSGRRERTASKSSIHREGRAVAESGLLLYSENRVLRGLGNSELDDGLGRDPDLLLRLGVETRPRLPLLFYQLPEAGQDEFAVLFDLFVGQGAECIEKHSSHLLVSLSGLGERNLKFCFGHLLSFVWIDVPIKRRSELPRPLLPAQPDVRSLFARRIDPRTNSPSRLPESHGAVTLSS